MKKKLTKSNGIVINHAQLKSDSKITLSIFLAKVESKNPTEVITKDMWYKLHPTPYRRSKNDFACTRTVFVLWARMTDTTGTTGKSKNLSLTRA
jgi:hypothetical protein